MSEPDFLRATRASYDSMAADYAERFGAELADMTALLELPDGALGGVLAWYSTVHIPQERLPEVFTGCP